MATSLIKPSTCTKCPSTTSCAIAFKDPHRAEPSIKQASSSPRKGWRAGSQAATARANRKLAWVWNRARLSNSSIVRNRASMDCLRPAPLSTTASWDDDILMNLVAIIKLSHTSCAWSACTCRRTRGCSTGCPGWSSQAQTNPVGGPTWNCSLLPRLCCTVVYRLLGSLALVRPSSCPPFFRWRFFAVRKLWMLALFCLASLSLKWFIKITLVFGGRVVGSEVPGVDILTETQVHFLVLIPVVSECPAFARISSHFVQACHRVRVRGRFLFCVSEHCFRNGHFLAAAERSSLHAFLCWDLRLENVKRIGERCTKSFIFRKSLFPARVLPGGAGLAPLCHLFPVGFAGVH